MRTFLRRFVRLRTHFAAASAFASAFTLASTLPWPGAALAADSARPTAPPFVQFESGPVRPIVMSPDRTRLFVANTPNNSLEVFDITPAGLSLAMRVPVGLEPVAVAAASNDEVWVVNHLSDSVSVVSLLGTPRVVRTLLVGDEPRDIVFAGQPVRAFVTTAHRGQHRSDPSLAGVPGAGDPQLNSGGIGRADVWVFDPANLGTAVGGRPLRILSLFADTPRALAVSPDRRTVYVAAFKSGNQTTTVLQQMVCTGFKVNQSCKVEGQTVPGGNPGPRTNVEGRPAPETSVIVKYNPRNGRWEDVIGRNWSGAVRFKLPDLDVFAVDAATLNQTAAYAGVGTVLFNMVANPVSGNLYVSNTEANNLARFEGPGRFGGSTVQGNLARSRISVISAGGVAPRHLNKHIDYSKLTSERGFDFSAKDHSLATPTDMVVSRDGRTLYVAAFGSSRIGVYSTAELEADTFDPRSASARFIDVSGGGPAGLVLDEDRGRLYVATRFDNAVKVIDLATKAEVAKARLPNPEPASVVEGRPFLYDAKRSSANGEASCASCHVFGDMDDLAWDLGNPDDAVTKNPLRLRLAAPYQLVLGKTMFGVTTPINGSDRADDFHPMKGPMTTQTLRGMRNSGAMHWRGDRSTGPFGTSARDSELSFKNFAAAFQELLGNRAPLGEAEMKKFADFQLAVLLPPNPVRNLDNSLTPAQQRGKSFYTGYRPSDGINATPFGKLILGSTAFNCEGCHRLDPAQGLFGTGGDGSFEGLAQIMKIPHLRNVYQKVGMYGAPKVGFFGAPDTGPTGDQVRGFGFQNDGAVDSLYRFFTARVFDPQLNAGFPLYNPDATRRDVAEFVLAFDSDLAPIVGQQVTLTHSNAAAANPRIDLLLQRAAAPFTSKELGGTVKECDLVARVAQAGVLRGLLYDPVSQTFAAADGTRRNDATLRALAATDGQEVTYTCTPPGSGGRIAFNP
jgi:DNA-binding beta-propeller fold protein YncE